MRKANLKGKPMGGSYRIAIFSVVGIGIAAVGAVFLWRQEPVVEPVPIIAQSTYIPPPPLAKPVSPVRFTDVTAESGIDYKHFNGAFTQPDGSSSRYMPETMGPGVALLDYDQDGLLDLFVTNSTDFHQSEGDLYTRSPRLYRNLGNFVFQDVTLQAGISTVFYGMGAAVADYDADTFPDLFISGWGGLSVLRNKGDGTFEETSEKVLPSGENSDGFPDWVTGMLLFDADGDSDIDLYLANYVKWKPEVDVFATLDGAHKSYATPDLYEGSSSRLYLQEDGRFTDQTELSGMLNDNGKSLGAALWDFNGDGLLDIAVANDTQPNFLYFNLGGGKFEDRALQAGIAYDANGRTRAGMGIDISDIGNDGHPCIAVGNFSREPVSIFRSESETFFREISHQAGVAEPTYLALTFGVTFADFDLDGWLDLVTANGHIEPEIENVEAEISFRQSLLLLGNNRQGVFENWSETAGDAFTQKLVGRGLAVGDMDGDGDLDVVVTENNGALHLLRNEMDIQDRHFVRVKLQGKLPNTDAIGAKVELLTASDQRLQQRFVRTGSSYLSQSEFVQTFGLGSDTEAKKIRVTWPGGEQNEYLLETFNRQITIDQNSQRMTLEMDYERLAEKG